MKKIIPVFIAMLFFSACENSSAPMETIKNKEQSSAEGDIIGKDKKDFKIQFSNISENEEQAPQPDQPKKTEQSQAVVSKQDWDKKIIKNASINLEIKDFKKYNSLLREKVKQVGGYVAQEEQNESEYKIENSLTIKVPVDQFDNAVNLLIDGVDKLNEKKITSQDVTTEFVDTKSRIESKKQVRLRYLELLKQARNMNEILSVQSEINGIQEQIESASGRIEYLSHSSSFSTINLTFYQILNESFVDTEKTSFAKKLSAAFSNGWDWVGEVFVGIISIWPLLIVVLLVIGIYRKANRAKVKPVRQ